MTISNIKELKLTRLDKLKLTGLCIKSVTAIAGGSLILTEGYPWTTLIVLAIGGVADTIVNYIKEKELLNTEPPIKND